MTKNVVGKGPCLLPGSHKVTSRAVFTCVFILLDPKPLIYIMSP